jgi:hypothetical protein
MGFNADSDPDSAFKVNADPDADPDPVKNKKFTAKRNNIFVENYLLLFSRAPLRTSKLQEAFSPQENI